MRVVVKYNGKHIDTFELAMRQLFEFEWGWYPANIDSMGLRCFGFSLEGEIGEWFRPMVSVQTAVQHISDLLGVPLECGKIDRIEEISGRAQSVVLGPVETGLAVAELRNYYYKGGHYLFVHEKGNGQYEVFDPQGMPGLVVTKCDIDGMLRDRGTLAVFTGKDVRRCKEPDGRKLLAHGMEYRRIVERDEAEIMEKAVLRYRKERGNGITLRYGIFNLLLQLDKVFFLADSSGFLRDGGLKKYLACKHEMYRMGECESVSGIPDIYKGIWRILEHEILLCESGEE